MTDVQALWAILQGTCLSLEEGLTQLDPEGPDGLTPEEASDLDQEGFLCEDCSWWCEASEANENPSGGGDLCDDCKEESE